MKYVDSWLNSAERAGYLDSAEYKDGVYTLTRGDRSLQLMRSNDGEVLLWSKADPTKLKKVIGSGVEKVLPRLIVSWFTGIKDARFTDPDNETVLYKDVAIFPSRVISGKVEFSDHAGRKWLCQSSNVPNLTLAFYKLLYDGNCDMSALMLPMLKRRDDVKVFSGKGGDAEENVAIVSSVEDFERSIPNLREYFLFPKTESVPSYGTAIVSGLVVSSNDKPFISEANTVTKQFLSSALNQDRGYFDKAGGNLKVMRALKLVKTGSDESEIRQTLEEEFPGSSNESIEVAIGEALNSSARRIQSGGCIGSATVLLEDDTVVEILAPAGKAPAVGESVTGLLHDENGNPIKKTGKVAEVLESSVAFSDPPSFRNIVSSAEILRLKMDEAGKINLDMGHIKKGHEVYSSIIGTCDAGQLIAIGKKAGFTYSDIMSGVDFSQTAVLPELKKFLTASAKFQTVHDPVINRNVAYWVISGKELNKELSKWGLNNPGNVFSKVEVLGVDLDGNAKFKVPVKSGKGRIQSGVTYEAYVYDLWGNEEDGYEVNDVSGTGRFVEIEAEDSDESILLKLGIHDAGYSLEGGDGPDDVIYAEQNGVPAFELRPINSGASRLGFKKPLASGKGRIKSAYGIDEEGYQVDENGERLFTEPWMRESPDDRVSDSISSGISEEDFQRLKEVYSVSGDFVATVPLMQEAAELGINFSGVEEAAAVRDRLNKELGRVFIDPGNDDAQWDLWEKGLRGIVSGKGRIKSSIDPDTIPDALADAIRELRQGLHSGEYSDEDVSEVLRDHLCRYFSGKELDAAVAVNLQSLKSSFKGRIKSAFGGYFDEEGLRNLERNVRNGSVDWETAIEALTASDVFNAPFSLDEATEMVNSWDQDVHSSGIPGRRIKSGYPDDEDEYVDYDDGMDQDPVEPEEGDIVVNEYKGIYEVGGQWYEDFEDWDQAEQVIKEKMQRDNYYPNVWQEDDHGGYTLTSIDSSASRSTLK